VKFSKQLLTKTRLLLPIKENCRKIRQFFGSVAAKGSTPSNANPFD
jgi:hypothetical protein